MKKFSYIFKLANKMDKSGQFRVADLLTDILLKLSNNEPFELQKGLAKNDPKTVMEYFMGYAFDMFSREKNISQKKLIMELSKEVDDRYSEMSDENKELYANLKDDVIEELKNQVYWNDLPEETLSDIGGAQFDSNSPGFENAFNYILDVEGGFSEYNPQTGDPSTNLGIIQSEYDKYRSEKGLEQQSVRFIEKDEAKEIYQSNYWLPTKAEQIYSVLPKTAITIFDFAVNSGLGGASSVVSKTLDIPSSRFNNEMVDSIIKIGQEIGDDKLSENLIDQRYINYDEIISHDPRKAVYKKGWHNRLKKLDSLVTQI
jgi:lysozyme family protein